MPCLLVNIDVPNLAPGTAFYSDAFGLEPGRRIGSRASELLGLDAPLYLLERQDGSSIDPAGTGTRSYARHWSPVHLDLVVVQEGETTMAAFGELAMFADPFGHGFCLIRFNEQGYAALDGTPDTPDAWQGA